MSGTPPLFQIHQAPTPMKITVRLFATLRQGRFDHETLECDDTARVADIIERLDIPEKQAAIIFVNSRHADLGTDLHENDTLAIFPPIGGG